MATLAESFLADLDDLSDVSDQEEGAGQDDGEDEEVSLLCLTEILCIFSMSAATCGTLQAASVGLQLAHCSLPCAGLPCPAAESCMQLHLSH